LEIYDIGGQIITFSLFKRQTCIEIIHKYKFQNGYYMWKCNP
jgi:hypothetical protein